MVVRCLRYNGERAKSKKPHMASSLGLGGDVIGGMWLLITSQTTMRPRASMTPWLWSWFCL